MKKLLILLTILVALTSASFAAEETQQKVKVELPKFDVSLNENIIDNTEEKYPFIVYNDITYIPMTWDLSNAIGLKTSWNSESGLSIQPKDTVTLFVPKSQGANDLFKKYTATVVDFPVTINGKTIDNSKTEYPLLNFRNVTYFPMTWNYMVEEFSSKYSFNPSTGLHISANPSLDVNYPEPKTYKETIIINTLKENGHYVGKYFKITKDGSDFYFETLQNKNNELHNYIYDIKLDYYSTKNKYLYSYVKGVGRRYQSSNKRYNTYIIEPLDNEIEYGKIVVNYIFRTPSAMKAITAHQLKERNIEIEMLNSNSFSKEKMLNDNAVYCKGYRMTVKHLLEVEPSIDEMKYSALYFNGTYMYKENGPKTFVLMENLDGTMNITLEDAKDNFWKVKSFDDIIVNNNKSSFKLEAVSNNQAIYHDQENIVKLYDQNKNLIKIYILTDTI